MSFTPPSISRMLLAFVAVFSVLPAQGLAATPSLQLQETHHLSDATQPSNDPVMQYSGTVNAMVVAQAIGHNLNGSHHGGGNFSAKTLGGVISATRSSHAVQEFSEFSELSGCSVSDILPNFGSDSACLIARIDANRVFAARFET